MAGYGGVLGNIPGLGGFVAGQEEDRIAQEAKLQQVAQLQGILSHSRADQREVGLRGALSQLGPDATTDQVIQAVRPFAKADDLLKILQGSADRRFAATTAAGVRQDALDAKKSNLARLIEERDALPQGDPRRNSYDNAIRKESETAKQISPTIIMPKPDKVPLGYRLTQNGNLEAIPGGPADTKHQGALNIDTQMLENSQAELDRLQREAARLKDHPGLAKSTGLMSVVPGVGGLATIPGTDVANFKAGLETLKSQAGLSVLQNMRNNSKTGGALGQVSDFENRLLQANLGSLNAAQSEDEFKAALDKIINYTDEAKGRLRNAYNLKHGPKQSSGLPDAAAIDAEIARRRGR